MVELQYKLCGQSSATVDFRLYHSSAIQGWKTAFRNLRVSNNALYNLMAKMKGDFSVWIWKSSHDPIKSTDRVVYSQYIYS